ncbi:MAG: Gx transporter family protein [Erysipelotrichaceae bacterium]|nr:Gx transporter family protein [Erysipelotrichaceae bacterium]
MKAKKVSLLALTIALAMILSYAETLLPVLVAIPGVKAGFANIAVIFALYKFNMFETIGVSLVRIVIVSILFGNGLSFAYSVAGAVLSLLTMFIMKKTKLFEVVTVSIAGGIMHNVGQLLMANVFLETNILKYYMPFLLVSGIISGTIIGILGAIVIKRINMRY